MINGITYFYRADACFVSALFCLKAIRKATKLQIKVYIYCNSSILAVKWYEIVGVDKKEVKDGYHRRTS